MKTATLIILTPSAMVEREVESLTAVDGSGSFGVMARHTDFITVLKPCILAYRSAGAEGFAAVDGGVMRVDGGTVTIATRESVEGKDYAGLRAVIEKRFAMREEKEAAFMDLLKNMEKLLVDRMVKFERGA